MLKSLSAFGKGNFSTVFIVSDQMLKMHFHLLEEAAIHQKQMTSILKLSFSSMQTLNI